MDKIIIKNSLRSVWRNKKSYFSGIFVLAIGLGVFAGMVSTLFLFNESSRRYHIDTNFADAFATVLAMPKDSVNRLTRIDGIEAAQGTLKNWTNARMDGVDEIIHVLLMGLDESRPTEINQFAYDGEPIRSDNDIWLGSTFYNIHGLEIGSTIRLQIGGRYESFTVRGTFTSPEYLLVPMAGGAIQDDRVNTLGVVRTGVVEAAAGSHGMVNHISFLLEEGTTFEDVEPYLEDALERYGALNIIGRENHFSYMLITQQGVSIASIATIFPLMFLSIAAGMLYVTLKRLITMARTEIGTLKAIGFTNGYIFSGYLIQGILAAVIGFVMAMGVGWLIGSGFYGLIVDVFEADWMPFTIIREIAIASFLISLFVSLFGVIMGAKSAMKIRPAEAMRDAPPAGKNIRIKFSGFIPRLILDTGGKLAIRSMLRNKRRVIITVMSIALTFSLMGVTFTMGDFIVELNDSLYTEMQVSDGAIVINGYEPRSILYQEIGNVNGVLEMEAILTVPVVLENGNAKRSLVVYGLDSNASLFNIFDNVGNRIRTDSGGLILSKFFTDELGLELGQTVMVRNPNLHTHVYMEVTQIIEASICMGAYAEISELSRLFGNETVANMVMINTECGYLPVVFDELKDALNVSALNDHARSLEVMRENSAMNAGIFNIMNIVSAIICFAIVYNISSIALGEKQREYATLRVLGFQSKAVSEINTFEYVLMLLAGSVIGTGLAYMVVPSMIKMFEFENSIFVANLTLRATISSFVACGLAVAVSCFLISRQIKKFDLVDVLKER